MIDSRIRNAVVVLAFPFFLLIANMPMPEEVEVDDKIISDIIVEDVKDDYEPHITIHTEQIIEPKKYNQTYYVIQENAITPSAGVFAGPNGKESYYNLGMGNVIRSMRDIGYSEEEYPYWIREDGAKMLGQYVMVAANLELRPKGTIIETSLGEAIVCDTGGFAAYNPTQLDIATDW